MNTAVCTLFEGDYHYGVGALVNSLYEHGFRGVVWAGYRGDLPFWAKPLKDEQGYQEFVVAQDCVIRFIKLSTTMFFTYYKPDFMLELWQSYCPDVEALFYFDPDIVNKCRWGFYEEWVSHGITLCEDGYPDMADNHPRRLGWKEFAQEYGYTSQKTLDRVYNGGFIGLKQSYKPLLSLWQKFTELFADEGYLSLNSSHVGERAKGLYTYPYVRDDQDVLNLVLMLNDYPLSTFGPEGMDFGKPGSIMSHAAGGFVIKAWRKNMVFKALGGVPPTLTDKLYYQHAHQPIPLYSRSQLLWKKAGLYCAVAIGRFMRRTPASA